MTILDYYMQDANNSVMSRTILVHSLQIFGKKNYECIKCFKVSSRFLEYVMGQLPYCSGNADSTVFYLWS